MVKDHSDSKIPFSIKGFVYAPCHRQDSTYQDLFTPLSGAEKRSMIVRLMRFDLGTKPYQTSTVSVDLNPAPNYRTLC